MFPRQSAKGMSQENNTTANRTRMENSKKRWRKSFFLMFTLKNWCETTHRVEEFPDLTFNDIDILIFPDLNY